MKLWFLCAALFLQLSDDLLIEKHIIHSNDSISKYNALSSAYVEIYPDSALFYAKRALDEAEHLNDGFNRAVAKKSLGEIFYMQGAYDYALSYLTQALHTFQTLKLPKESAQTRLSLGSAYQFHGLWNDALIEYKRAQDLFRNLNDSSGMAQTFGVIGHYYEKQLKSDSGFLYQNKALAIYKKLDDYRGLAIIYDNIGSLHEDLENFNKAYQYFLLSARYDSLSNNLPALVNTLNNIADTYRKRGVLNEAVQYTNQALFLADSLGLGYEVLSAYEDLNKVYREHGQLELAMAYYDSAYQYSEELFNSQIAGQIANFQTLYDTQDKEQEIKSLEAQQRIERQERNAMIFGSIGVLFFLVLVAIQERNRRNNATKALKAQEELSNEKIKNIELEQKTLQTELENKRLKEEQFYREIEDRSQDLTHKTLHIIQKNRLLRELREQITQLHKESKIKSQAVKKLSTSIDKGFQFDREWEHFQETFDQVHDDFAKRIKHDFPSITESEVRLSALIRMGLSSKDIAGILGITTDSLRVSKSRLKKKLNPPSKKELKPFLVNY